MAGISLWDISTVLEALLLAHFAGEEIGTEGDYKRSQGSQNK